MVGMVLHFVRPAASETATSKGSGRSTRTVRGLGMTDLERTRKWKPAPEFWFWAALVAVLVAWGVTR